MEKVCKPVCQEIHVEEDAMKKKNGLIFLLLVLIVSLNLVPAGFADEAVNPEVPESEDLPPETDLPPLDESTIPTDGWYTDEEGNVFFYQGGVKTTGLLSTEGALYYFDHEGKMQRGWVEHEDKTYFFGNDGKALLGWQTLEGASYYFGDDGAMVRGWAFLDGSWYYFHPENGQKAVGWQRVNNRWYYLMPETGAMAEGWLNLDEKIYYLTPESGAMAEGWRFLEGHWYYFLPEKGHRAEGWRQVRDRWYYLEPGTGIMLEGWRQIRDKWYYLVPEHGHMAEGWRLVNDSWYYLVPEKGHMAEGWQKVKGEWYYLTPVQGNMYASRWLFYKEDWYYLTSSGKAAKGLYTIKGVNYFFDEVNCELLVDGSKPLIALTFDDGPSSYTAELLDFLYYYNAKATFFVIGSNIPGRESLLRRQYNEGHTIGNHSYNHPDFTTISNSEIWSEVSRTDSLIYNATGVDTVFFRPPYGATNSRVQSAVDKAIILWDVDTRDWDHRDAYLVRDYVLSNAHDGAIVLMHDIHYPTITGVKMAIPTLIDRGYQLVSLDMLFKIKGRTPQANSVYYSLR